MTDALTIMRREFETIMRAGATKLTEITAQSITRT
jgi:hypothetical protein